MTLPASLEAGNLEEGDPQSGMRIAVMKAYLAAHPRQLPTVFRGGG